MDLCCQPVSDYGRAVFFLSIWRLCRVLCRQTMCRSAVWQYCDVCLALIFLSLCHMVFARCNVSYCFPVFLHAGALSAFLCYWLLEPSVTFCYMAATVIVGWLWLTWQFALQRIYSRLLFPITAFVGIVWRRSVFAPHSLCVTFSGLLFQCSLSRSYTLWFGQPQFLYRRVSTACFFDTCSACKTDLCSLRYVLVFRSLHCQGFQLLLSDTFLCGYVSRRLFFETKAVACNCISWLSVLFVEVLPPLLFIAVFHVVPPETFTCSCFEGILFHCASFQQTLHPSHLTLSPICGWRLMCTHWCFP